MEEYRAVVRCTRAGLTRRLPALLRFLTRWGDGWGEGLLPVAYPAALLVSDLSSGSTRRCPRPDRSRPQRFGSSDIDANGTARTRTMLRASWLRLAAGAQAGPAAPPPANLPPSAGGPSR